MLSIPKCDTVHTQFCSSFNPRDNQLTTTDDFEIISKMLLTGEDKRRMFTISISINQKTLLIFIMKAKIILHEEM